MNRPLTTGEVARLLDRTEPQLADLVRRKKVDPAPTVTAGRREWTPDHVRQAAEHLGQDVDTVLAAIEEVRRG